MSFRSRRFQWLTDWRFVTGYAIVVGGFLLTLLVCGILNTQKLSDLEQNLRFRPPVRQSGNTSAAIPGRAASGQTVYVPVYSHVYANGGRPVLLETTLSIRNTDARHAITVTSVTYHGTDGKPISRHLDQPLRLGPLASTEFLVEEKDISGGVGANFMAHWVAESKVSPPVIETVMVGLADQKGIAFARPGRVVSEQP